MLSTNFSLYVQYLYFYNQDFLGRNWSVSILISNDQEVTSSIYKRYKLTSCISCIRLRYESARNYFQSIPIEIEFLLKILIMSTHRLCVTYVLTPAYFVFSELTNIQHSKFAFCKTNFVLLALILE